MAHWFIYVMLLSLWIAVFRLWRESRQQLEQMRRELDELTAQMNGTRRPA